MSASLDSQSPTSPVGCRWATSAKLDAGESQLVDLPPSEQVARGKELLSILQEGLFNDSSSTTSQVTPPSEAPPPQSFEMATPASGLHAEVCEPRRPGEALWKQSPSGLSDQHQQSGGFMWRSGSSGLPAEPIWRSNAGPSSSPQQQQLFVQTRSPPSTSGNQNGWNMGGCMNNGGAQGTWSPLSTNPSGGMNSGAAWLSTGVSDAGPSALAARSAVMRHVSHSSASSEHDAYSMTPHDSDSGLWSPSSPVPGAHSNAAGMVPSMAQAPHLGMPPYMPQMTHMHMQGAAKPVLGQLRAEAAPYVPMNMGVGVPAY